MSKTLKNSENLEKHQKSCLFKYENLQEEEKKLLKKMIFP